MRSRQKRDEKRRRGLKVMQKEVALLRYGRKLGVLSAEQRLRQVRGDGGYGKVRRRCRLKGGRPTVLGVSRRLGKELMVRGRLRGYRKSLW